MALSVEQVMELAPVIPVLVVERVEDALPIARALVKGGLPALEVTLRTPAALDVIREMAQVEGAVVGAGTVLNPAQLDAAMEAGARFIVSPGLTEPLGKAAIAAGIPSCRARRRRATSCGGWTWDFPISNSFRRRLRADCLR